MSSCKRYEAFADTGRDFISFEFFSEYRANSKNNLNDATKEYEQKHGHKIKVINTCLLESY